MNSTATDAMARLAELFAKATIEHAKAELEAKATAAVPEHGHPSEGRSGDGVEVPPDRQEARRP